MQIYLKRSELESIVRDRFLIDEDQELTVLLIENEIGDGTPNRILSETKGDAVADQQTEAPKRRGRPKLSDVRPVEKTEAPVEEAPEERPVVQEPEKLAEAIEELPEPVTEAPATPAAEATNEAPVTDEEVPASAPRKSLFGNLTRVVNEPAEAPKESGAISAPADAEDDVLEPSEDEIAEEFGTSSGDGSIVDEIQQAETSGGTKTAVEEVSEPVADEAPKPRPSLFANLKK